MPNTGAPARKGVEGRPGGQVPRAPTHVDANRHAQWKSKTHREVKEGRRREGRERRNAEVAE